MRRNSIGTAKAANEVISRHAGNSRKRLGIDVTEVFAMNIRTCRLQAYFDFVGKVITDRDRRRQTSWCRLFVRGPGYIGIRACSCRILQGYSPGIRKMRRNNRGWNLNPATGTLICQFENHDCFAIVVSSMIGFGTLFGAPSINRTKRNVERYGNISSANSGEEFFNQRNQRKGIRMPNTPSSTRLG